MSKSLANEPRPPAPRSDPRPLPGRSPRPSPDRRRSGLASSPSRQRHSRPREPKPAKRRQTRRWRRRPPWPGPTICNQTSPAPAISRMRYPRFGGWHLFRLGHGPADKRAADRASPSLRSVGKGTNRGHRASCRDSAVLATLGATPLPSSRRRRSPLQGSPTPGDRPSKAYRQSRYQPKAVSAASRSPNSPRFRGWHLFASGCQALRWLKMGHMVYYARE